MPTVDRRMRNRARDLRQAMSLPEVLLWRAIRERKVGGRFRRQHPLGPFVLDFFCDKPKLAIEVDGSSHHYGDRPDRDAQRDRWLQKQGVRVLRVPARTVLSNIDAAISAIEGVLQELQEGPEPDPNLPPHPASRGAPP